MVSVIVPTRNSARTIESCLISIREQSANQINLIVVDNHSTDGTREIAERLADRVEVCGPERSAQRNRGAELATGDYLLFIDSDMRLGPTVVSECVSTLKRSGAPAVIVPEISVGSGFWTKCRALERSCYHGVDDVEAARFFSRQTFQTAGGYHTELVAFEDWDLSDRIAHGQSLPRTEAQIVHDEGRLRLGPHLGKKYYYGRALLNYMRTEQHGRSSRLIPSAYLRNWKRLIRHPVLTAGIVFLKTAEAGALVSGMVVAWRPKFRRAA